MFSFSRVYKRKPRYTTDQRSRSTTRSMIHDHTHPIPPPAGPLACLALTRPGLARPIAARLGSTWLGSGSARCLGSGLQARPGLALDRVQPGPGLAPKVVVSRTQDSNHGVTEAKKFKKYGAEKIQQQSRNSAGLGLAVAQPSSARPSSTCPASARPGPAQVRAAQLRSSPFSSAQLASAQLGLDTAPTHPLIFVRPITEKRS